MEHLVLEKKKVRLTTEYRHFLQEVQSAFNKHCELIRTETLSEIRQIPEENKEAREKVVNDQKQQLDKTLSELKTLLNKKSLELRIQLEDISKMKDQDEFNLDDQLASL